MKKNLTVGLMICGMIFIFSSHLPAVDWGFKLGSNKVNFDFSNEDLQYEFYSSSKFIFGTFLTFNISNSLAIQPEIYYSARGMDNISRYFRNDTYRHQYKISYFEIPLLLKYKIPVKGKVYPGVFMGPYLGLRNNAKFLRIIDHGEEEQFGEREDIKDYIKSIDYGLVLGGSIEIKFCFGKIILDVRYSHGFVNIAKNIPALSALFVKNSLFSTPELSDMLAATDSIKNKAFTLMIGFGF